MRRANKMFEGIPRKPDGFISPEQLPGADLDPEAALIAKQEAARAPQEEDEAEEIDGDPESPLPEYEPGDKDFGPSDFLPIEDEARHRMYEKLGAPNPRQRLVDAIEKFNEKVRDQEIKKAGAAAWADAGFRSNKKRTPKPPGKRSKGDETIRKSGT